MGKIKITCDISEDSKVNANTIDFRVKDCTENSIANALREIFTTVIKNKLVKPSILIQVLEDILTEMFKSGLGA